MHILFVPSFYPAPHKPLNGTFLKAIAEALARQGHRVNVLVVPRKHKPLWGAGASSPLIRDEDAEDITVYRMYCREGPRLFPLLAAHLNRRTGLKIFERYLAEQGRPDIIHAYNMFYGGYIAAGIGRKYNIPLALSEQSSHFLRRRFLRPGQYWVVKDAMRKARAVSAVSTVMQERLKRFMPQRHIEIIGNVVDTHFFEAKPPAPATPFVFCLVARLVAVKRVDLAIRAFAQAFPNGEAELHIGGYGALRAELEALAAQLGVAERVVFHGGLSRQEVRDLFHRCHAVLSTSDTETFGVTIIEALSCGRPVIATRSGGPQDILSEEVGMLVPRGDVAALARALRELRREYGRYSAEALHAYVEARYSEAAIVRRFEALYEAALA